jgi:PAS domain-containing protein
VPVVVDGCRRRCLGAVTAALDALDRDTALFDPLSEGDRPGGPHYGRPRPVSRYTTGVTDRKERERELERQKDPFSKAEDLAAVLAWEHDLGSDNLYWTDQVYEIHGCSDDFEPSIERVAELSHPDDRRKLWEAVERATTAGEPYDIADERTFTAPI